MKKNFIKITKPFLAACAALTIWISVGITSIIFFGEYEYPQIPTEER